MDSNRGNRKLVVAGLVIDGSKILLSQRLATQAMPLKWEFPGGKIELGESPEVALKRELMEEIGVSVEVGRIWDVLFHAYPEFDVLMLIYPCVVIGANTPKCLEVADFVWTKPEEMPSYDILDADSPLVDRLIREGAPYCVLPD